MWDQMQVFCKRIADHQIRFVLHFESILDEKTLKDAIKITVENNPIICAKYDESKKKVLWRFSEINLEEIYSFQISEEPEHILDEILLKQINTYSGPQLFISLIRSETDILILNCNHAISDAAGVKDFVYQLAQNYTNLVKKATIYKQEYIPSRSLKALSKKLRVKSHY